MSKSCRGVSLKDISDTNRKLFGFRKAVKYQHERANKAHERHAYSLEGFG